jgi:hypothetical protein
VTGYEIFGVIAVAILAGSILYLMWKIAKTIKE